MPDMTIASIQVPAYGILQMVEVMQSFDGRDTLYPVAVWVHDIAVFAPQIA